MLDFLRGRFPLPFLLFLSSSYLINLSHRIYILSKLALCSCGIQLSERSLRLLAALMGLWRGQRRLFGRSPRLIAELFPPATKPIHFIRN